MTEQTTSLTLPQRAAIALNSTEHERKLVELAAGSKSIGEITNTDGREQCHAARMALKRVRVDIEKTGKAAREDATAFSKAVIAEEKRLIGIIQPEETRLDGIQTVWDEKVAAEKRAKLEAEQKRVAAIHERIDTLRNTVLEVAGQPSAVIAERIKDIVALEIDDGFGELKQQAEGAKATTLIRLRTAETAALNHEAEQKRLAEERAEFQRQQEAERVRFAAESDRLAEEARQRKALQDAEDASRAEQLRLQKEEADRLERERQEAAAAEQARLDKLRADQEAAAQAERDQLAAERAEADRVEAERKAAADAQAAQLAADRARLEQEQAELRAAQERATAAQSEPTPDPPALAPPPSAFKAPEPAAPWRPTDEAILHVLSETYNVPRLLVITWLGDMDLQRLAREAA